MIPCTACATEITIDKPISRWTAFTEITNKSITGACTASSGHLGPLYCYCSTGGYNSHALGCSYGLIRSITLDVVNKCDKQLIYDLFHLKKKTLGTELLDDGGVTFLRTERCWHARIKRK
jgi:hypothetical protein